MAFTKVTSPHAHRPFSTGDVMRLVLLATLPGLLALTWFFGWGTLINLLWACCVATVCETGVMLLRKRPVSFYLKDCSALVTAVLLALALPPYAPWWITLIGISFAIIIAKQIYGGLGYNPFNPAMVGYVVLLISFPIEMTSWPVPRGLEGTSPIGFIDALHNIFPFLSEGVDAITMATPLDVMDQNKTQTINELYQSSSLFSNALIAGYGYECVNLGFLLGGLFLLKKKIFTWHTPLSFLLTLFICAIVFYDGGSSASKGSPWFHLFSGATMLGAFFILTDPVTAPTTLKGKIYFGICSGLLVFIIRSWGNFPDAVAFSVLLMNLSSPLIDYYSLPRTYGHKRTRRATEKENN